MAKTKKARNAAKLKTKNPPRKKKVSRQEAPEGIRRTKIRVFGIGGGGSSIVAEIAKTVSRADFVSANTDLQAQKNLPRAMRAFAFGQELTKGLGCGMDAELGEAAAKEEKERIKKLLEGQDICILVASLGGGTGSGAAPVFAETAREAKCLTLGIFTLPFAFEGQKRRDIAEASLEKTIPHLNAYCLIPNENIFRVIEQNTPLRGSFSAVNKRLAETLEGFIDTLSLPGLINIDFADIKTLLEGRGKLAYLNSIQMQGAPKAQLALKEVLNNPLYDYTIAGAERMVFNVTGDKGLKMHDVAEISRRISSFSTKARIIFGVSFAPEYRDKMRIALFATGCRETEAKKQAPASAKKEEETMKPKPKKKPAKKKPEKKEPPQEEKPKKKESGKMRRNALDLKKAHDKELKDLEQKERQWDIPAFLRNARGEEPQAF